MCTYQPRHFVEAQKCNVFICISTGINWRDKVEIQVEGVKATRQYYVLFFKCISFQGGFDKSKCVIFTHLLDMCSS